MFAAAARRGWHADVEPPLGPRRRRPELILIPDEGMLVRDVDGDGLVERLATLPWWQDRTTKAFRGPPHVGDQCRLAPDTIDRSCGRDDHLMQELESSTKAVTELRAPAVVGRSKGVVGHRAGQRLVWLIATSPLARSGPSQCPDRFPPVPARPARRKTRQDP